MDSAEYFSAFCRVPYAAFRPASIRTLDDLLSRLGAYWSPSIWEGAAILTSASELANSPAEPRVSRRLGTRHLLELRVSLCCGALCYLAICAFLSGS